MGMQNYTHYCTAEQTIRAYKLGAPIKTIKYDSDYVKSHSESINEKSLLRINVAILSKDEKGIVAVIIPTTQQLIGWLREKGLYVLIVIKRADLGYSIATINHLITRIMAGSNPLEKFDTYEQAELAAIDAALDYLEKGDCAL